MSNRLKRSIDAVDVSAIRPVADRAHLIQISCRELSAKFTGEDGPGVASLRPDVQFSTDYRVESDEYLKVRVRVLLTGKSGGDTDDSPERDIVRVNSVFELLYGVDGAGELEESALKGFSSLNGLYNAWPYAREALQTSTARMGLPPYTLDLLKVPSATSQKPPAEDGP